MANEGGDRGVEDTVEAGGTRRPRRRREGTAARRDEILRAATRTFGSKGYHNGSLAEVADQVGITHAGVLHHFGSKDNLLIKVLEFRDQVDVEDLEGKHIPAGAELFAHLVKTAQLNESRRGIVQAYAVLTGESVTDDHPARDWVTARFAGLRAEIATALREMADAAADGSPTAEAVELSDEDLDRAASAIIGVMDGLQVQWLLDPAAVDLAEASGFAIEAILASALAGAARQRPVTRPAG